MESTIYESFILPSKGLIYDKPINPNITLRSMTTLEEMKRLSPTDSPYKVMSDIIEDCMKEPPEIHVYDMALGDYQFLLHKLRIVTYGPDYKMTVKCWNCGEVSDSIANLESLKIGEWTEDLESSKVIMLPRSHKQIELKFQTPSDLDAIAFKAKETKQRYKQPLDYSLMYTLMSLINKVDGQILDPVAKEEFVKCLPNMDANFILNKSAELNKAVGLDNTIKVKCEHCGEEINASFRITSEFFGPTIL